MSLRRRRLPAAGSRQARTTSRAILGNPILDLVEAISHPECGMATSLYPVANPSRIPVRRYHDPAFFEAEREHLWTHAWQMACRLEEIPQVGDYVEYRIV